MIRFTVEPDQAGRLDRFLAARLPGIGRRRWAELIGAGEVRVNGRRARKGDLVPAGAVVELSAERASGARRAPVAEPDLPLEILHQDARLVAVGKPAGMPSHPLGAGETGTLAGALVARFPECAGASEDPREGGLVHRLDRGTSGVLVAARDREAWRALRRAFAAGQVAKRYLALVSGVAGAGASRAHLVQRGRRSLVADPGAAGALSAETRWEPVAVAGQVTLLRATTSTGRMHQVRAHLAAAGHPLIGDPLYGGPAEVDLPVLHAEWIALPHPDSGARLEVRAPLPADRRALLERLGLPPLG